jgi:hydrogenase/urease accessory protein HupE
MMRAFLLLALCAGWAVPASAHKLTLSVLAVEEVAPGEYLTRWQLLQGISDASAAYLLLRPVFPEHCQFAPPRLVCGAKGLTGRAGFLGLGELSSSAVMQITHLGAAAESYTFSAGEPQRLLRGQAHGVDRTELVKGFVAVGIEHIFLGWDHLAFVLGLLWLVRGRRALLETITAFTVGHSITLTAAALGYADLPAPPVEAVIALSIGFVVTEVVKRERSAARSVEGRGSVREQSMATRAPWLVAGGFGLLHGLGFANALREAAISRVELPWALLGFNLGVELGQLAFVASMLLLGGLAERFAQQGAQRLLPLAHYLVGGLAMYWFIERVCAFADG